ncbi:MULTISPECIES: hypothetical protein [unclassified Roseovarius]|uniref:hypothetical protein n=1 Tax=unclassified Roseovarius TaxID=2614913 RepID=UPI000068702A|nr:MULTISPECIES: hypothetical protein [unclassified Roseovarius]EAQ23573.1 hypothetical protein ROS217_07844 [Roseovarius sp. 217]EDM33286.1 hypothetical protein RTM1035_14917 [Roseovarius sp. TM1035]
MNITNRSRHATAEENAYAAALEAASRAETSLPQAKAAGVNVKEIQFLTELLARHAGIERNPEFYLEMLMNLTHHILYVLEAEHLKLELGSCEECGVYPPHLPPFPSWQRLLRLDRAEQERLLDKRASELLREIEGLRRTVDEAKDGYYIAPPYINAYDMIENARRKFSRLRNTALKLGHWTDGRWDDGEEETHRV